MSEENLGEMGAVAAGAFPLDEKHEAKKDPEHADSHKIEEGLSSTTSTGGATFVGTAVAHKRQGGHSFHMKGTAFFPKGVSSSVGVHVVAEKEETKKEAGEAEGNHEKEETKKEAE